MDNSTAIEVLKKYHDSLHNIYADYVVYTSSGKPSQLSKDDIQNLAFRANTVKLAVSQGICALEEREGR